MDHNKLVKAIEESDSIVQTPSAQLNPIGKMHTLEHLKLDGKLQKSDIQKNVIVQSPIAQLDSKRQAITK